MNGILLIDKPVGWTSFDVVAKVRGELKKSKGQKIKVGHAGTLDPLASGLLIILVGDYCRRADEFLKLDKTYEVKLKLGQTSSTDDEEGEKQAVSNKKPSQSELEEVLKRLTGKIMQTPPAFSAIKVQGQRAYKLARAGKPPVLDPRAVTVYEIGDLKYAYPQVEFTVRVSSGTYIRSLARDIGDKLGTGAFLTALRRTQIDGFPVGEGIDPRTANPTQHTRIP